MLWAVAVALLIALAFHLSIVSWARERRLERELFYEHETTKNLLEREDPRVSEVVDYLRQRDEARRRGRREALKLGAFVWTGLGIGMLAGLRGISRDHVYWPLGFIPLLVGFALAAYLLTRSKETL